jgi:hypothetical protein
MPEDLPSISDLVKRYSHSHSSLLPYDLMNLVTMIERAVLYGVSIAKVEALRIIHTEEDSRHEMVLKISEIGK